MTITATIMSKRRHLKGPHYIGFFVFSGSYTAAGDSVTAGALGLSKLDVVTLSPASFLSGTELYLFGVVPTSPDQNGRFTAFTLPISDMVLSTGVTADLTAGAYPAGLTGLTPGLYFEAIGF